MTCSRIVILEDDSRRRVAMRDGLARVLPGADVTFFDCSATMIEWLAQQLPQVSLICLDHDLPIRRDSEGHFVDNGNGRDVAEFLATQPTTCPVVVHSSDALAAADAVAVLKRHRWPVTRVYPADDLDWIGTSWLDAIQRCAERDFLKMSAKQEMSP